MGARNRLVAETAQLHKAPDRRERGQTLLEGPNLVDEAVRAGARIPSIFALSHDGQSARRAEEIGASLHLIDDGALARLADTVHPQGPVAVLEISPSAILDNDDAVVLWGVADPGNTGTIIRTAAAFGLGVMVVAGGVDPWSPKVLRAAAGGHFRTKIEVASLAVADLHTRGWRTVAAVVQGGTDLLSFEWPQPCALLIGEEAAGLPAEVVADATQRVSIPMSGGVESLNAGVAAALLMWELSRQEP